MKKSLLKFLLSLCISFSIILASFFTQTTTIADTLEGLPQDKQVVVNKPTARKQKESISYIANTVYISSNDTLPKVKSFKVTIGGVWTAEFTDYGRADFRIISSFGTVVYNSKNHSSHSFNLTTGMTYTVSIDSTNDTRVYISLTSPSAPVNITNYTTVLDNSPINKTYEYTASMTDDYYIFHDADSSSFYFNVNVRDSNGNTILKQQSLKRNNYKKLSLKKKTTYYITIQGEILSNYKFSIFPQILLSATSQTSQNTTNTNTHTKSSTGPSFEEFVERLYVVALNRDSEPEGKAYWCEHVGNGDLTGAACAREFLSSVEFNNRGLSDEQFLTVLYKTFFDREAANDPDGFNFWLNSLKTQGRDTVVEGFINSTEWCNICASYGVKSGAQWTKATIASKNATVFAERLYTKCLGRDAESEGLNYWSLALTNLEVSGSTAANQFFNSPEFIGFNTSNEEYLTRLYRTFMGREPDDEGMNYWLGRMMDGMTRDQVFDSFVTSKEFTEICKQYGIDR